MLPRTPKQWVLLISNLYILISFTHGSAPTPLEMRTNEFKEGYFGIFKRHFKSSADVLLKYARYGLFKLQGKILD